MGHIILVTGGARSGKSTLAERIAGAYGQAARSASDGSGILYVATCEVQDDEMADRVRRHRMRRPAAWRTLEASSDVGARILSAAGSMPPAGVLLDCVTLLVSACMARTLSDWETIPPRVADTVEAEVRREIDGLLAAASALSCPVILVTNELGMGLVPEHASGRLFRDVAGRVNQQLAEAANEVYLCVSGIPVRIKPFPDSTGALLPATCGNPFPEAMPPPSLEETGVQGDAREGEGARA